ncbi:Seven in absentia protein family, partial [Musa troglodytarum]
MCSFFSPSPYDRSHGSPGGGGGQEASTWTLFRSPECMSLSVDAMDEEEVAPVRNSLKPPGAGDGAAGGGSGLPATQITSNSRVNELLECPVCTNTMYPPIHQCRNGHTLCSSCKPRVQDQCPTCRQELGDIRCLALEKVAEFLDLPCKYLSLGCPEIFPYYNKLKHEAQCNFRPYNCPYAGWECSAEGDIPFLVAHLRDDHKLGMAPVYIVFLQFMGDENEAHNYRYSLEVGSNGRKLTWEGIPRSIRDSHQEVRDSHDGLIIQRNLAIFFSGNKKDLKLRVTGRIWKEEQNSDTGL